MFRVSSKFVTYKGEVEPQSSELGYLNISAKHGYLVYHIVLHKWPVSFWATLNSSSLQFSQVNGWNESSALHFIQMSNH